MSWYEKRFEESNTKFKVSCACCGKDMWFPKSKIGSYKTCGVECSTKLSTQKKQKRKRNCCTCGKEFIPRISQINSGIGKYCSRACAMPNMIAAAHTEEANKKRAEKFKQMIVDGKYSPPVGINNPKWKGGQKETTRRRIQDGRANESVKKYRKNNPHKVKEFNHRRKSRSYGRLPEGTINQIGDRQNWKCVVCSSDISKSYHVDHIYPLSSGGQHIAKNIQLLCPTCNVRKSNKDPIEFMQSRGFLL